MAKKFPLDLSKFKKTSEDDKFATLTHQDGHSLRLAKSMLSPERQDQLSQLEMDKEVKMAEGGDPEDTAFQEEQQIPVSSIMSPQAATQAGTPDLQLSGQGGTPDLQLSGQGGGLSVPELAQENPVSNSAQTAPARVQNPSEQPQSPPTGAIPNQSTPDLQTAYTEQLKGINQKAQAEGAYNQARVKSLEQQRPLIDAQQLLANKARDMVDEQRHVIEELAKGHIDENRFLNNRSTGTKIANAIGLILGGMSAGTLGGENPAVKAINDSIARDIDEQKANLTNQHNVVSAYTHLLGNQKDALTMAQYVMTAKAANDLDRAAAAAGTPLAQAQAHMAKGQLMQSIAPAFQQMAMRQVLQDINKSSAPVNVDPASLVQHIVPPGMQPKVLGEIERAQNTRNMSEPILAAFDKAVHERLASHIPGVEAPHMKQFLGLLNTTVTDLTGTARQAEFDNVKHNFSPTLFASDKDIGEIRRGLEQYLQAKKSAPAAKSFGIDLDKFASTQPVQTSPQIKIVNGIKYMRGPHGEAIKVQ